MTLNYEAAAKQALRALKKMTEQLEAELAFGNKMTDASDVEKLEKVVHSVQRWNRENVQ